MLAAREDISDVPVVRRPQCRYIFTALYVLAVDEPCPTARPTFALTGVGVLGGAAVGANVGRASDGLVYSQDVQRCEYVPTSGPPDYWDVTYVFAGREHRAQMTAPPGAIILVNAQGEPRV